MAAEVKHEGIITSIDKNKVFVNMVVKSACASCKAKGFCSASEMADKVVEIDVGNNNSYEVGQQVNVIISKKEGNYAVLLGYGIPFIVAIVTLIAVSRYADELTAGIATIIAVGLYYLLLFLYRKRVEKKFVFKIESREE
ncbi:MAG: SoxR reducing system RseC family protein [Lentimicrobiaceae bacterium]|nr:SoxR reducing system RseC family protein [Lentimicrobiaceae bacterium]